MDGDDKSSPKKVKAKALPKKVNSCGVKTISHKAKKSEDKDASAKTNTINFAALMRDPDVKKNCSKW